jgi:ATP-dependent DNA helicase RecQ
MQDTPLDILQQYWGHSQFRPTQESIIQSVLAKKDVLALLPTGGGKSICFQVPALLLEGVCIVVSPLIALMKDQAENLTNKGIPAATIHSGMNFHEVKLVLQDAVEGDYKFLYLSPERLETKIFKDYLALMNVSLLAIDEAHCVSQWGYDFRPTYLRIAAIRASLPGVPLIALTASATPLVQKDILAKLEMQDAAIFHQSFNKPNLSYSVFKVESKIAKLVEILQKVAGSGIVYCNSRKQTKNIAYLLVLQGIEADFYHAGLDAEERNKKQDDWINNRTRIMACTNAFGLGIDKPDVRTVVHYDAPECLENYYQEAGRAGRDGQRSYAILLYQSEDLIALASMPDKRYPPIRSIRKVYQELANYLQLPVGLGEGQYFDFDLANFCTNFQLDSHLVTAVLKILEQEGHCSFSEKIFLPTQVQFTTSNQELREFETHHPLLQELIKTLLRTYEGIFSFQTSINENKLSIYLRQPVALIQEQLLQLKAFGMIEYLPKKEKPQIHFLLNRASADYLLIDQDHYLARKEQYRKRLTAFLDFIQMDHGCRSNSITQYFGEATDQACGICDNCLNKKKNKLGKDQFNEIFDKIKTLWSNPFPVKQLMEQLDANQEAHVWEVLQFMIAEGLMSIDEEGIVRKR